MVLSVRYEDLVNDRELAVNEIARELGLESHRRYAGANVDWPVGWSPTGGFIDGWRKHWTNADEDYFFSIVARDFWGVYNG